MEKIGPYKIIRIIGRAGVRSVYLAEDTAAGRQVAVTVIPLRDDPGPEYLMQRIEREAAILGQLNHPNIVKVFDVGRAGDLGYIVVEYVEGDDLSRLMRDRRITGGLAATVLEGMAEGLDYAHAKGVIHRDVKPGNVLVGKDQRVLFENFCVAQESESATETRMIMGTLAYMSPEHLGGKELTGAADQFSLGVVAYQLLTGSMPFEADSTASTMLGILQRAPRTPYALNRSVGNQGSAVILKALEKDPGQRYASCKEFVSRLMEATDRLSAWS